MRSDTYEGLAPHHDKRHTPGVASSEERASLASPHTCSPAVEKTSSEPLKYVCTVDASYVGVDEPSGSGMPMMRPELREPTTRRLLVASYSMLSPALDV